MDRRGFIKRAAGCLAALFIPKAAATAPEPMVFPPVPIDTTNEAWGRLSFPSQEDVPITWQGLPSKTFLDYVREHDSIFEDQTAEVWMSGIEWKHPVA